MSMQIPNTLNQSQIWGIVQQSGQRSQIITRNTNNMSGGLNNMTMINRVRFAKAGCSSCGGAK